MTERISAELKALRMIESALDPLDIAERDRVIAWTEARYKPNLIKMLAELEQAANPSVLKEATSGD
jgi:hypothetical protein